MQNINQSSENPASVQMLPNNQAEPRAERVGSSELLDFFFAKQGNSIIISKKTWSSNQEVPDSVDIQSIPYEIIDRINKGEVIAYDGQTIRSSSQKELVGIVNVYPESKSTHDGPPKYLQHQCVDGLLDYLKSGK